MAFSQPHIPGVAICNNAATAADPYPTSYIVWHCGPSFRSLIVPFGNI